MKQKGLFKFVLLLLLVCGSRVFSLNNPITCEATRENPCIVQDSEHQEAKVPVLRDARLIKEYFQGNTAGVENLHLSLSAQPSQGGWKDIADYIQNRTGYQPHQVLVLDLRQESHGYLNGNAITLCDLHNWLNLGKTAVEAVNTELEWLSGLSKRSLIANVLSVQQFTQKDFGKGQEIPIESVSDEKTLVHQAGFNYQRLTITDHRAPEDNEIDAFVSLIIKRPQNSWIHLHCRGGKGRSTTVFAMYDMLINADKASFDEIIERLASIPPYYDLRKIVRKDPALTPYYQQRLIFLGQFYQYAQQRLAGYSGSWSDWKSAQII